MWKEGGSDVMAKTLAGSTILTVVISLLFAACAAMLVSTALVGSL